MEFAEVVRKRRMVRHFKPDPIDPAVVNRMLDLARRVPSAGYTQGQSFVVVTDPETRREIGKLCGEDGYVAHFGHRWISEAPVQVIPCVSEAAYHARYQEPDKLRPDGTEIEWPVPFWFMDIGMSVMTLLLAVVDEGLAAGYAGIPETAALRDLLGIPPEVTPVGVIPIGYPAPDVPSPSLKRGRKPLEDVVHWERW
ncbi:nitroreductase family protein [Sphaerobacter thermophilus]|uniref:Nitroreductase n=1 Tax=Sphaerobacter thermophilus (strain ATCC 49802 / DSM 20745 / KCCM 41009 / NCIMB 13125 / S 6022) TaxID=479434 RepID=D1C5J2_SPHTD|nr:nitroreductase family protein [Sphaerobacter thermophilus]ACZ37508.1 nitroreductase [Sphaerobacter thermophilus DSM 20745]